MSVGWLLDLNAFDTYRNELADAICKLGHRCITVNRPAPPYQWEDVNNAYRNAFPAGDCVVAHGDIDLVRRIRNDKRWRPGVFATVDNFYCSKYYAHFGSWLLNSDFVMLPYAELPRCRDLLFSTLGRDGRVFVRPDSPLKLFTGMTIGSDSFESDYKFMRFHDFPVESLVVVSSPKQIVDEWRYVVVDGQIVTASKYMHASQLTLELADDPNASAFATTVAKNKWRPDPVYILDIGKTADGQYRVLEVGGFSFSSLYSCDKSAVVSAVSQVAARIHQDNCGYNKSYEPL